MQISSFGGGRSASSSKVVLTKGVHLGWDTRHLDNTALRTTFHGSALGPNQDLMQNGSIHACGRRVSTCVLSGWELLATVGFHSFEDIGAGMPCGSVCKVLREFRGGYQFEQKKDRFFPRSKAVHERKARSCVFGASVHQCTQYGVIVPR